MFYFVIFSDLQNLLKCMDSMFPWYSLRNMEVVWLYTPSPHYNRENFVGIKIFSFIYGVCNSMRGVKIYGWKYFLLIAFSLFHFFRKTQHSEKWSVSFKNLFWECECISCYWLISLNLLKMPLEKLHFLCLLWQELRKKVFF